MAGAAHLTTPLVSTEWLAEHLDDPKLRILDATVHLAPPTEAGADWSQSSGRPDYEAAHIPGAAFADIIDELSEPDGGWFTKPTPERFAAAAGRLGIGPDTTVVVYAVNVFWATRVWWLLLANGFDNVAVLDGGFGKWTAEGRPTRSGTESYPPAEFVGTPRPELFADLDEVRQVVESGTGACLINSLSPEDFHATETLSYPRPGRIPGSRHVFVAALLNPADGTFRPVPELREIFRDVQAEPGRKVTYCGGGIAATGDALALHLIGETDVAVYDGSLREWTSDPTLPLEVG
ncbi:sulfurtransferase [Micromonospora yangpuensis]|uniref:Thiosulfate/3-mercaptopyruvate sulfurtransferase n=1 Tax=Micromonospora yangpuensis TaxID=683228 RepID=A0A1C6UYU6_9ACTN|nr:sulfurtransferase [Micromonospora yangpuensis]GGL95196.1 sulfurtransferase [Micromonospora yangpuensis]SCL59014.1 thiosulfate/3-mercaptopyruvate sulfurtransferase [Micromonospora yangpuensis]